MVGQHRVSRQVTRPQPAGMEQRGMVAASRANVPRASKPGEESVLRLMDAFNKASAWEQVPIATTSRPLEKETRAAAGQATKCTLRETYRPAWTRTSARAGIPAAQ